MIKKFIAVIVVSIGLTGCGTIMSYIPSFKDSNQSASIINVRLAINDLDCAQTQAPQVTAIQRELTWFELYSTSRGRQTDVLTVIEPLQDTVTDMLKRVKDRDASVAYCQLKQRIMTAQAARAAEVILGRF